MKKYLIAAVLAIAFALIFFFNTFSLPPAGYQLPRILVGLIILLSVLMIIEGYRQSKKQTQHAEKQAAPAGKINYPRVGVFAGLIAAYILTIETLGYFIVTPAFILTAFVYLKSTNVRNMILITIGFTAFVYLLFVKFLHLPIPMGFFA